MKTHPGKTPTVLIRLTAENDVSAIRDILQEHGIRVQTARTLAEVRELLDNDPADAVVADSKLHDNCDWKDILCEIELSGSLQPLIVTSHAADGFLWAEVLNLGGFDVLAKPFAPLEVTRVIDYALRHRTKTSATSRVRPGVSRAEKPVAATAIA